MSKGPDCRDHHRTVRSFVRRAGRMTAAQKRALNELWPRWGIDYSPEVLDFDQVFGRPAPLVAEVGFGNGQALIDMAREDPDSNFVGIEVHEPGVGHCLLGIEREGLTNVRLIRHDAVEVLADQFPDGSLARVHLLFPDPWPKKRHHKRRLVQPEFVTLLAARLQPGGLLQMATDWEPYAEQIVEVVSENKDFELLSDTAPERSKTRFETRGEKLGHRIFDLVFMRK